MAKKSRKDHLLTVAKETLVGMYRALERERDWFMRLEQLRLRVKPVITETIAVDEFDQSYPGETLMAEVFAPNAPDGGVLRLVWNAAARKDCSVAVFGFEQFLSDNFKGQDAHRQPLYMRILAERLSIAEYKLRTPAINLDAPTYPKVIEYGDLGDKPRSEITWHTEKIAKGKTYKLISATAGYEPAGSMMRWTDGYWAVRFELDGATHGQRFTGCTGEENARKLFAQWTVEPSIAM